MSKCFSMDGGEWSDHLLDGETLGSEFICSRCFAFDEDAAEAEIDQLATENAALRNRLNYVSEQYGRLLAAHEHVVMDTPEDRELHGRVIATFKRVIGLDADQTTSSTEQRTPQ